MLHTLTPLQELDRLLDTAESLKTPDNLRVAELNNIAAIILATRDQLIEGLITIEEAQQETLEVADRLSFLASNEYQAGKHEFFRGNFL